MNSRNWFGRSCQLGLSGLVILVGLIGGEGSNLTFAQVTPDPSLGTEVKPNGTTLEIRGGTTVGDKNLFHSFSNFSVKSGEVVDFRNASSIKNTFVRVTGGTPSDIQGKLQVQGNLFLINPNGILFGRDAKLSIGGSFIGTTASAIQFPGGGVFSMTSQVNSLNPLLTVNPSAFLFNQIASSSIQVINRASLNVNQGQSLLLLGGDVILERGKLSAPGGRVELGGLAGVGTVGLNFDSNDDSNNLRLSFPQGVQRADVSLNNASNVTASSTGGGSIQVQGKHVTLTDSDIAANTFGSEPGGTLVVNASELVELQGSKLPSHLKTETSKSGAAGELRIETPQLIVKDGSQVSATTSSEGQGGRLSVTADSIQLMGANASGPSGLFARTEGTGNAGDLKIETGQLIVRDGAQVSASTDKNSQGRAGTLSVSARDSIQLIGTKGESRSGLFIGTEATGSAGNLDIKTGQLIVQDGARISAATTSGEGGNINLQVRDLILMRGKSQISASASNNANGGNITINAKNGFIVAVPSEYSNIIAKAEEGRGGNIKITSSGIYGFVFDPDSSLSNINASSKAGPQLNGTVEINTPDVDPSRGLVNLPITPIDTKVSQVCQPSVGKNQSSFIITGRGGLPPNPREPLSSDAVQVDWVTLNPKTENRSRPSGIKNPTPATPVQIVQATGWTRNAKGEVVLTADAPIATSHSSWQTPANCGTAESIK